MSMKIGTKLGLGFGGVIGLMSAAAVVVYLRATEMNECSEQMTEMAGPAVHRCLSIRNATNRASAAIRGYAVSSGKSEEGRRFKEERAITWAEIEGDLAELRRISETHSATFIETELAAVIPMLQQLGSSQAAIEELLDSSAEADAGWATDEEVTPIVEILMERLTAVTERASGADGGSGDASVAGAAAEIRGSLGMCLADLRAFAFSGDGKWREEYARRWSAVREEISRVRSEMEAEAPELRRAWEECAEQATRLDSAASKVIASSGSDGRREAIRLINQELEPQRETVRGMLARMQNSADGMLKESRSRFRSASEVLNTTLIAATVVAVVAGVIVAGTMSRRIARALQQVVDTAKRIASGDLRGESIHVGTRDEIGELAGAFNAMREGLREMARQIQEATENLTTSTAEMATSTREQAAAAKEQATTVQEISSTLKEISESGAQIEERARHVSLEAESTSSTGAAGTQAAQEVNMTVEGIREQVEQVAENIVSLSARTQAIGELIATVTDVAEQANLLALNASIEAVSAGEQGNRFSVVANEMKSLADQAKDCTVRVRTILGEIQKGIHGSVMLTEEAVKRAELGKRQSDTTENTIRRMADTTSVCVRAFQQIVGGTNQQQIGVAQVTQGMDGIRQAVQQTATGTVQLEKAAANLSALSHQLQNTVRRYQL